MPKIHAEKLAEAQWIDGPPNDSGLWIVQAGCGEYYCWRVYWETITEDPDDHDREVEVPPFLRFSDDMDDGPVDWYHKTWPLIRSYGPIQYPNE